MRGPLAPPRGRCWWELPLPQACSFVCVCVFIGGSGEFFCLLLFPIFFFFLFGLWLAPGSRSVEGQQMPAERGPGVFRRSREGSSWIQHGNGFVERVCEVRRVRCWDVISRCVSVCSPRLAKIYPITPKEAQKRPSSWERNCLDFGSPGWDSGCWGLSCTQRAPFSGRTLSSQERWQESVEERAASGREAQPDCRPVFYAN